jgi:competence CoiA-like predicted nuclease
VWWLTSIIAALMRRRQEDCEFEGSLGYTVRWCLKINLKTWNRKALSVLQRNMVFLQPTSQTKREPGV